MSIALCPHCSADIRAIGAPGICWHCKKSLSSKPDDQPGPAAAAPDLPTAAPGWNLWILLGLPLLLAVLSVTKTLMMFFALPMVLIFSIGSLGTRLILRSLSARGASRPHFWYLARLQLVSGAAAILLVPGYSGNHNKAFVFLEEVSTSSLLYRSSEKMLFGSLLVYFFTTAAILISYVETRRSLKSRP